MNEFHFQERKITSSNRTVLVLKAELWLKPRLLSSVFFLCNCCVSLLPACIIYCITGYCVNIAVFTGGTRIFRAINTRVSRRAPIPHPTDAPTKGSPQRIGSSRRLHCSDGRRCGERATFLRGAWRSESPREHSPSRSTPTGRWPGRPHQGTVRGEKRGEGQRSGSVGLQGGAAQR